MNDTILENHRALLRPLCPEDEALLLPFSEKEPETWHYSPSGAAGHAALQTYLAKAFADKAAGTAYPFIVIDKASNTIAGSTRYYNINSKNRQLEIGFTWYGQAYRGTGLNKHCKYLLLEHAFETLDCLRVGFKADATNAVSVAAMKSLGAREEGILRQDTLMSDGRFRDTMVLSILQSEWQDGIKQTLQNKLAETKL